MRIVQASAEQASVTSQATKAAKGAPDRNSGEVHTENATHVGSSQTQKSKEHSRQQGTRQDRSQTAEGTDSNRLSGESIARQPQPEKGAPIAEVNSKPSQSPSENHRQTPTRPFFWQPRRRLQMQLSTSVLGHGATITAAAESYRQRWFLLSAHHSPPPMPLL